MAISPREFAEQRGLSERAVRKRARELGACRILGKRMWFENDDVLLLDRHLKQPGTVAAEIKAADAAFLKRSRAQVGHGFIYFLQCDSRIKIGFAKDVKRRIADISCACPFPVKLLGTQRGSISEEQALHKRFAAARVTGEWFNFSDDIAQYITGLPK